MFPTLSQYNRTIQKQGSSAFTTLTNLSFIPAKTLPIKIYSFGSGSFAVVFKALENGKEVAIRCFIGTDDDYVERYRKIDNYLKNIDESWKTDIQFLDNEIKVEGKYYPVLKMDWVEGNLLDKYINKNLNNNEVLTKLQKEFVKTSKNLEKNYIAHGDIQCGNIIIEDNNGNPKVRLIDYDGLFIPTFRGDKQKERGRSEFQHPNRANFEFNEKIDRFSFWVILCALEALKYDKTLWKEIMQGGFNTLDNMLFVGSDFIDPIHSKLFQRLLKLNQPSLNFYIDSIKLAIYSYEIKELRIYDDLNSVSNKIPVDDIEAPGTINGPSANEYKRLKIESTPNGATVKNKNYVTIGNTPLTLNKYIYLNEEVKIILGTKVKTILVDDSVKNIFVNFEEIIKKDKTAQPIAPPIAPPTSLPKKDYSAAFIISSVVLTMLLIIFIISKKNNSYTDDYPSDDAVIVDSAAVVIDSAAAVVDSAAVFTDTDAETVDNTTFTPEEDFTDSDKAPTVLTNEVIDAQAVATQSSNNIANNETYTIIEGKLRSEGTPLSDIIKYIPSGKTVKVMGKKGDYYKVFYDGYTGYLNEMYLKKTYNMSLLHENNNKNSSQPLPSANNSYQETYTIIEGKLRNEDNPLGDIIKYIPSGKTVRVIGRKGEYFKVYYDGYTGYLNEMYLKMTNTILSMKR